MKIITNRDSVGEFNTKLDIAEEGNGDLVNGYKEITYNLVARWKKDAKLWWGEYGGKYRKWGERLRSDYTWDFPELSIIKFRKPNEFQGS